jgi:hypothetical protein
MPMTRLGHCIAVGVFALGVGTAQANCLEISRDLDAAAGWQRSAQQDFALAGSDAADASAGATIATSAAAQSAEEAQTARDRAVAELREARINRQMAAREWARCR